MKNFNVFCNSSSTMIANDLTDKEVYLMFNDVIDTVTVEEV